MCAVDRLDWIGSGAGRDSSCNVEARDVRGIVAGSRLKGRADRRGDFILRSGCLRHRAAWPRSARAGFAYPRTLLQSEEIGDDFSDLAECHWADVRVGDFNDSIDAHGHW